ncbi:hypothetical protein [Methylocaldum sp.]|uniref:hypothetical protein n=1 Tax=Methylocaldum sp. TaxID=1969727 RepID=UPI002D664976|nr:hypothetical protein [Methylocaldum sp.]HYE35361.1 hypothetical protein [Methylocaldum sp.]
MNKEQFSTFISSLMFMYSTEHGSSAFAATNSSSTVSSSISSVSVGGSHAQAVITGQHGTIALNGDRVEVKDGRLTWNGVPHGVVGKNSVVKYTVNGTVKKLFVDGVERRPDP